MRGAKPEKEAVLTVCGSRLAAARKKAPPEDTAQIYLKQAETAIAAS